MVNLNKFFKGYVSKLDQSISEISIKKLTAASTLLKNTIKKGRTIYVCGNGGSAAIANHYVCDFLKYFRQRTKYKPKIISLSNSIETITAISNDMDYKDIFKYQLESVYRNGDILIIISSSGNSRNVKEVLNFTNKKKEINKQLVGVWVHHLEGDKVVQTEDKFHVCKLIEEAKIDG